MSRPKSNGPYAPLAANYYRDDAILEAGEQAELLFVRCLSFLADASSDGFITERQMRLAVGIGMRNVPSRVATLLEVGLIEHVDGGYLARSWLKWNKSTEEIGKYLKRDRERKARKPAELGPNSARNEIGNESDSAPQSTTHHITTQQSNTSMSDADASDANFPPEVYELCELLGSLIRGNGNRVGAIGKAWWLACDRLIRLDGYTPQQVEWVIRWSQSNEFWQANILSMGKLREKFDTVKTQALNDRAKRSTQAQKNLSTVEYFEQEERMVNS